MLKDCSKWNVFQTQRCCSELKIFFRLKDTVQNWTSLSDTKTLFRTDHLFRTQRRCLELTVSFRHKDTVQNWPSLSDTKMLFRTDHFFRTQRRCSKLTICFRHKDTFEVPSELTVSTGADGTNDEVLTAGHSFWHCLLVLQLFWYITTLQFVSLSSGIACLLPFFFSFFFFPSVFFYFLNIFFPSEGKEWWIW